MQSEMETRQRAQSTAGKMKKNLQGFFKISFQNCSKTSRGLDDSRDSLWSLYFQVCNVNPHLVTTGSKSSLVNSCSQPGHGIAVKEVTSVQLLLGGGSPLQTGNNSLPCWWSLQRGQELNRSLDVDPEQAFQRLPAPAWLRPTGGGEMGGYSPVTVNLGPFPGWETYFSKVVNFHFLPARGSH